jgi:uncharacterized protein (UPF0335 family)
MTNPNINTRKFIELSGLGKTSFYKYTNHLEASGHIAKSQVKNQVVWYVPKGDRKHSLVSTDLKAMYLEQKYKTIESKIIKSMRKARKKSTSEKIDIYSNAVLLVLATLDSMKLVSLYRKQRVPIHYVQFVKKLELLLKKISNERFFSDYGYGRIAIDSISYEAEAKLDEFLGISSNHDKKVSVY